MAWASIRLPKRYALPLLRDASPTGRFDPAESVRECLPRVVRLGCRRHGPNSSPVNPLRGREFAGQGLAPPMPPLPAPSKTNSSASSSFLLLSPGHSIEATWKSLGAAL